MTLDIDAIEREAKAFPLRPDPEDIHRLIAEVRRLRAENEQVALTAAAIPNDGEGS